MNNVMYFSLLSRSPGIFLAWNLAEKSLAMFLALMTICCRGISLLSGPTWTPSIWRLGWLPMLATATLYACVPKGFLILNFACVYSKEQREVCLPIFTQAERSEWEMRRTRFSWKPWQLEPGTNADWTVISINGLFFLISHQRGRHYPAPQVQSVKLLKNS